jgi:drug/metabolite transporter (DMT)-like permease
MRLRLDKNNILRDKNEKMMNSRNYFYFFLCSSIWGTTWWVITYQIGSVSPAIGVFYRFLLSSLIMFVFAKITGQKRFIYSTKYHLIFMLQGLFNYCLNYILTYKAEKMANSAFVALTFTSLLYFNMIGLKIWFKKRVSSNVITGAIIGASGIILVFWREIESFNMNDHLQIKGILLGLLATFFASLGNMFGHQNHRNQIPVSIFSAYAMMYGALFSLGTSTLLNEPITFPLTLTFLSSLLYLSVFGTVIAFWSYQTLIGSIGADKAAYTSIISTSIAVIISHIYEKLTLTPNLFLGIALCLLGNIIALWKKNKPASRIMT